MKENKVTVHVYRQTPFNLHKVYQRKGISGIMPLILSPSLVSVAIESSSFRMGGTACHLIFRTILKYKVHIFFFVFCGTDVLKTYIVINREVPQTATITACFRFLIAYNYTVLNLIMITKRCHSYIWKLLVVYTFSIKLYSVLGLHIKKINVENQNHQRKSSVNLTPLFCHGFFAWLLITLLCHSEDTYNLIYIDLLKDIFYSLWQT